MSDRPSKSADGETLRVRPADEADLPAVVALLQDCDVEDIGRPDTSENDVLESWHSPGMQLSSDTWVAVSPQGSVAGYAEVTRRPGSDVPVELDGDVFVHPDHWDARGDDAPVGEALLARVLERARQMASGPTPARVAVYTSYADSRKRELLEAAGFAHARTYLRLRRDLPPDYDPGPMPPGLRLAEFDPATDADLVRRHLLAAFSDEFRPRREPLQEWRARLIERPDFDASLWLLTWEPTAAGPERLVAAVLAYDFDDIGWVQAIAVRADRRRHGIGGALLRQAFARLLAHGQPLVCLGVDVANASRALHIYERAGMQVEERADLYLLELD